MWWDRWVRVGSGALVVAALFACKKKSADEQALEKYSEKGKARVAALEKVAGVVKSLPPTTSDTLKLGSYRYTGISKSDNFAFLQAPALDNLAKPKFEQFELPNRIPMFTKNYYYNACSLIKTGKNIDGSGPFMVVDDEGLKALVDVQYVGVVRALSFDAPKVIGPDQFTSGKIGGDVIVFDLENGAQLGAFQFSATNAPNVKVDVSKQDDDLISDLGGEATRVIVQRFAALAPGASIQVPSAKPTASAAPD